MILKSVSPQNIGPYLQGTQLHIEDDVTVITGPNDTGKSLLLRSIELLCSSSGIENHEINRERSKHFSGLPKDDPDVICSAVFQVTEHSATAGRLPSGAKVGSEIVVRKQVCTAPRQLVVSELRTRNVTSTPNVPLKRVPIVVALPVEPQVRQAIRLEDMTAAEKNLIQLGFGPEFSLQKFKSWSPSDRAFHIRDAESVLNDRLRKLLPSSMPFEFILEPYVDESDYIGIGLIDRHRGFSPLGSRGSGIRRIISVMGTLLRIEPDRDSTIVLYDEPETSLHADAQHALRRLLEELATHPNVQVVYTTHSSAMLNPMRPRAIRIVERAAGTQGAHSLIHNAPFNSNYIQVRNSLGISPADSLLFAPVTLVVEGPTEVRCVPIALEKLTAAQILPTDVLERVLPLIHILDGEGSSFEYMCRLAKSQNAHPVVFVDGDKSTELGQLAERHPEVPTITLPPGQEFEDIVPLAMYIQAAVEVAGIAEEITLTTFQEWESKQTLRPSVLRSKRVERWLRDAFDKPFSKPRAMQRAIELTGAAEINAAPFVEILEALDARLKSCT